MLLPEGRRVAPEDGKEYRAVRLGLPLYRRERLTVRLRGQGVDKEQLLRWCDSEVSTYFNIAWPRDAAHGGAPLMLDAEIFCDMPDQPPLQQLGSLPVNITPAAPGADGAPTRVDFMRPRILAVMARLGTQVDTEQELQDMSNACNRGNQYWYVEPHTKPRRKDFQEALRGAKARNVLVVHFSGHGEEHGDGFVFDGEQLLNPESFLQLMQSELKQAIECVFLNACIQGHMAEALRSLGARWVVYWEGFVADATARAFAREFYACLNTEGHNLDYRYAFEKARADPDLERGSALPVLLAPKDDPAGDSHGWGDEAASSAWQQRRPALVTAQGVAWGGGASGEDDGGGDVPRNWRAPRHDKDWGALAGQSERRAMEQLGFAMVLPSGNAISEGDGIDRRTGFIERAALKVFGVRNYLQVWGSSGEAVKKAKQKLSAGGAGAVEVVTEAAQHLLEAERYRLSDMNAHSAGAGACRGTCRPAGSCTSCKHQHAHRQLQSCRQELDKLVQTHLASQGGAACAPGGGGAGAAKLSKGAKKNLKKKAKKAAAAGPPSAGGSDSDEP
jgi:hypothetical protein